MFYSHPGFALAPLSYYPDNLGDAVKLLILCVLYVHLSLIRCHHPAPRTPRNKRETHTDERGWSAFLNRKFQAFGTMYTNGSSAPMSPYYAPDVVDPQSAFAHYKGRELTIYDPTGKSPYIEVRSWLRCLCKVKRSKGSDGKSM